MKTDFYSYQRQELKGLTALITGSSSGIGYSTAWMLASLGVNLNLLARRFDRLSSLKSELESEYPDITINILSVDLGNSDAISKIEESNFHQVDILINNAGLALGREFVEDYDPNDWDQMIDVNMKSVFKLTHLALPHMIKNSFGDIVFTSSIAAHLAYEYGSVYCASKHGLRAFAEALRLEKAGSGIRVMQISPGLVETEFSNVRFKGDSGKASNVYQGIKPLTPEDIAYSIAELLLKPRHINIDDVIILASDQKGVNKVIK